MPLTIEQAQDLVTWAGGQRAAAREVGVAQSTISYWLHPEASKREQARRQRNARRRYQTNPEARRRELERQRERYHAETAIQRGWRLLRMRRNKALQRMALRQRRADGSL